MAGVDKLLLSEDADLASGEGPSGSDSEVTGSAAFQDGTEENSATVSETVGLLDSAVEDTERDLESSMDVDVKPKGTTLRGGKRKKRSKAYLGPSLDKIHLRRLYTSHFLSTWGDRMWEFAIALFLIEVWPDSVLLVSIYGLVMGLVVVLGGAVVGDAIDHSHRLRAMQVALVSQNLSVALSCACIGIILSYEDMSTAFPVTFWLLASLIVLFGAVGQIASLASTLAVEKDWVKTLCGDDSALLSATNAFLRRLDLISKILAPMAVGFIFTYLGTFVGAIFIATWNIISMFPEFFLLNTVFMSFPQLQGDRGTDEEADQKTSLGQQLCAQFIVLKDGFGLYRRQPTFLAGLALSMLYCTVLSFGSIMTAYAYYRGMTEVLLGAIRGIGACFGVAATFVFPVLVRRIGVVRTGFVSIVTQLALLGLCMAAVFVGQSSQGDCSHLSGTAEAACKQSRDVELGMLLSGVVASRVGLWCFDLSVSQLLQQWVPASRIATVNGVQGALNQLLEMLSYVLGVAASKPEHFKFLSTVSFAFVGLAALLYSRFLLSLGTSAEKRQKLLAAEEEPEEELIISSSSSEDEAEEAVKPSEGVVGGAGSVYSLD